jgi:hypothetical protein
LVIARPPEPHRLRAKRPGSELNALYKSRASPDRLVAGHYARA